MVLSAAEGPAYTQILSHSDPKVIIVDGAGKQALKLP
jgi:hypothetical protein